MSKQQRLISPMLKQRHGVATVVRRICQIFRQKYETAAMTKGLSCSAPSSDKILRCLVYSEKTYSLFQCSYVSRESDLLQQREISSRSFDSTVRSYQTQFSRGRGISGERNDGMKRGCDCRGLGRRGDRGGNASARQSLEPGTNSSVVTDREALKKN